MHNLDTDNIRIDRQRLLDRIAALAEVGAIEGGGVCRLALSEQDKAGRDLVTTWMRDLGLHISVDQVGNVVGVRPDQTGQTDAPAILTGSHIDTVGTGGRYDGTLGVLAGLEVMACLNDASVETPCPIAVGFFSNEEGVRFQPDMMGSMVHQGHLPLDGMLESIDRDGVSFKSELNRIGYAGNVPVNTVRPRAFVELHVEQGPVLEQESISIGAVEGVQGLSWREYVFTGVSNHAGTTPMALRHDAGYAAGALAVFARDLAQQMGGDQVATAGTILLVPNLVNVIAKQSIVTIDARNTDNDLLIEAETKLDTFAQEVADREGLTLTIKSLARYDPTPFDPAVVDLVVSCAEAFGLSVRRMPSGAGHDAQAFAPNCPTGMIFVPSVGGISHNVAEFTDDTDIESGTNILLHTLLRLAETAAD